MICNSSWVRRINTASISKEINPHLSCRVTKTKDLVKRDIYLSNMKRCLEYVVNNCIECIQVDKKRVKWEDFLNPIPKEDMPLWTYRIDFNGPLRTTDKNYNHIFTVIDAFMRFACLYPVEYTASHDAIQKSKQQQAIFWNSVSHIQPRCCFYIQRIPKLL